MLNLIIAAAYIVFGKLGLTFASINPSSTAIWPPTGIALAMLLFFGNRIAPALFIGAFLVNLTTSGTIITSIYIALGNTLEGLVGSYLVKKFANGIDAFETISTMFKFIFWSAIVSTMVSATIGVATLILGGLATPSQGAAIWFTWWLGDMGGNIIIAPLLLVWKQNLSIHFTYKKTFHFLLVLVCLFLITIIVFSGILPYAYLCIPLAVWIALKFEQKGATAITIIVTVIAIFYTLHGQGPFSKEQSLNQSLLLLQMFLDIFALTSLTFATTVLAIKKHDQIVKSHDARFKALIENSFDAVVLIDATSKILYASPSAKRLLGYSPEELQGMVGFDLILPEDHKSTMQSLAQLVLKPQGTVTVEYRAIRKDKKIVWIEATGTNLLFEPYVNAVVVNFHDITERKISQEITLQEKLEDEAMLSSIGEGIIATDNTGKITIANKAACNMLGWKEKELVGQLIVKVIPMENETEKLLPTSERPMTKVLSLGKKVVSSPTHYYVGRNKNKFPVQFTITPIILDKKIIGTIEVFRDITAEKAIDKAKSEFVSLASHQLRTPLTTISWYVEELIAGEKNMSEKNQHYLQQVYLANHRMVTLINALLNVSRLELGTLVIEPQQVNFVEATNQVLEDMRPQIEKKHITIKKYYPSDKPSILADAKMLTIIIQNILSNAVKYSKENGVVELKISQNKDGYLLCVKDNGYGIPPTQTSKIFTKMFRANNAQSIDPEGSGLGLYIVKSILDSIGGKIWFESEENKGSTFFVLLPPEGMKKKEGQKSLR